jgi:hypothetical protein
MSDDDTKSWLSHHWVTIVMVVVGGIVLISFLKVISQLFNGTGPVSNGLGQIFGAFAHIIDGAFNGCSAQDDCTKDTFQSESNCENGNGCNWNDPDTSGDNGSCTKSSDKPVDSGGWFSPRCFVGAGFIIFLVSSVIILIIGPLVKLLTTRETSDNVKLASEISGKNLSDLNTDLIIEGRKKIEEAIDKYEEEYGELSDDEIEILARKMASRVAKTSVTDALKGQTEMSQKEIAKAMADSVKNAKIEKDKIDKDAKDKDIDSDTTDKMDKTVDDILP